jgi:peptidoglycan glycosyltransferase
MQPYLVAEMATGEGETVWRAEPRVWLRPISAAAADQVAAMMVTTVEQGVSLPAAIPGYVVGGKTGTAEAGDGPPHAWFVGFAGDPKPRYAVAVVVDHGGSGLATALPIGRDLLAAALES